MLLNHLIGLNGGVMVQTDTPLVLYLIDAGS